MSRRSRQRRAVAGNSRTQDVRRTVRPPRTVDEECSIQGNILPAVSTPLSRTELHRRLDPVIRSWLEVTCTWHKRWSPGHFRYVIFSFVPALGTTVFVQFWSEPLEPVAWQVSSGRTDEATRRWLGTDRADRIRVFGFEIGGDAENFEQFVVFNSARDVARVSRAVVDILYSALDYRGQQPLNVELGAGTHPPTQRVFDSFTTTDVAEVMSEQGQTLLGIEDDEEAPVLRFRRRGMHTTVELGDRREGTRSFGTMGLTCELEPSAADVARLTEATRALAPPGAVPVVRLGTTLQFGGGVAMSWFQQRVAEWNEMISAYRREQRARPAKPSAHRTAPRVH